MSKPRRKNSRRRRGSRLDKEATLLVPLSFNDGTSVPIDTVRAVLEDIYIAFGGWTVEGTVKGAYRMQGGGKRVEDLLKVSVLLNHRLLPKLERMLSRWGAQLGQEVMLLKVADLVIRFIPPQRGGEP